jgi:hypothetical protein
MEEVVETIPPVRVEPMSDDVTMMSELPPPLLPTPAFKFKMEPDRE